MNVDVAIIGAGPGGGMAACRLASTGLKTLILEKATLPRHKPCGGGMPVAVKKMLDWDLSPYIEAQPTAARNLYNYTSPVVVPYAEPLLMVDRSRFDLHLIERAVEQGKGLVQLREAFTVAQVEEHDDGVSIWSDQREHVRARFVIAGDGAFSKTAHCLGLQRKAKHGIAIDAEVEVTDEVYEKEAPYTTFNFMSVPYGYGWIFPKDGYLSCGVGSWRGKWKLPRAMDDFLERSFPPGSIISVRRFGHPIPLYAGPQQIATRRVCLIGDAASLVDPIMGEGIRFALISGALAADVIAGLLEAPVDSEDALPIQPWGQADCTVYQTRVHESIGRSFDLLHNFITPLFLHNPEFFYRKFFYEGQNYFNLSQQLAARLKALAV